MASGLDVFMHLSNPFLEENYMEAISHDPENQFWGMCEGGKPVFKLIKWYSMYC